MPIYAIAAYDEDRAIGKNGGLPWPLLAADLRRFKELTVGYDVLMGRKTWESIPVDKRPLSGRRNFIASQHCTEFQQRGEEKNESSLSLPIISNKKEDRENKPLNEGPYIIADLKSFLDLYRNSKEILWIIGGEKIFKECLDLFEKFFLTEIKGHYKGNRFFPELPKEVKLISKKSYSTYTFLEYSK